MHEIVEAKYLDGKQRSSTTTVSASPVFMAIRQHNELLVAERRWIVGSGEKINLWHDNWLGTLAIARWPTPVIMESQGDEHLVF